MTGPGGWNQPPEPFGPDPNASQPYGTDPYYTEPYPSYGPAYGQPDPYAQPDAYGQYGQHGQQQYAQYPQTGGFYGPPPPPKRSKLPMILSLVAIVIIVGAVVAIVLVNRSNDPQPAANSGDEKSSSQEPGESSKKDDPSTEPSGNPDNKDDWLTIDNSAEAGLSYQVPPDWKQSSEPRESGFEGLPFSGVAEFGIYDCEGGTYVRTFATSGSVQAKDGGEINLQETIKDFANSFSATYYGPQAKVDFAEPQQTDVDGKEAMTVTAKVTPEPTKPNCEAAEGEVAIVGVLRESEGQPSGVSMLVVVGDTKGGPEMPKPAPSSVGRDILATVKTG